MSNSKTCICARSELVAKGLGHFVHTVAPATTIEYFNSTSEILTAKNIHIPIIFLDILSLAGDPGITFEKLKQIFPSCILVGLTDRQINDRFLPYLDFVIQVDESDENIINTLRHIYKPETHEYSRIDNIQIISERESEILKYVALGFTNKEISEKLFLSVHTVITHRKNITFKLGIKTIAGLTVYAILNGIISADEVKS